MNKLPAIGRNAKKNLAEGNICPSNIQRLTFVKGQVGCPLADKS